MRTKKVFITGKNEVALQELDLDAGNIQPNELVVETERSFISAGTELSIYTASDQDVYAPDGWCRYPWAAGYANVGVVLEAGERYRQLVGKRVYTNGPHASVFRYASDPRYSLIASVPDGIPLDEAAATRMAMIAMAGLDASKPQYIRWVVVIGLGMVGNLAAQLFKLTGAQVIGVDPSGKRRELARQCGIAHTISGTEEEVLAQVKQITGGRMSQVTVDAVGHSAICLQAVKLTSDGGEVIVLGTPRCDVTGNLTDVFGAAHRRWVTIKGCLEWNLPTEPLLEQDYCQHKKLDALFQWIADGRLTLKPLLTHVLPPEEIKAAYEGLLSKKEDFVGVVLKWK